MSLKPSVFVIYYSTYGHVQTLARQILKGVSASGVNGKLWQVQETLPQDVLARIHAPPKANDVPIINPSDLTQADGFLFGVPTRFGSLPGQMKTFFDSCGGLWAKGQLNGKYAGTFFSTGSLGGGQETTALSCLPFFVHMGMNFVPIGYKSQKLNDLSVAHGGSPWGAGTLAGSGDRQPTDNELEVAYTQGLDFGNIIKRNGSAK